MTFTLDKSDWKKVEFGAVIDSITNRVDNPSGSGLERYVGLEHLEPNSMTINRWGAPDEVEATKLLFKKGDTIFGRRRAYQKKVSMADFSGICSAHALVLRGKPGLMDSFFLPVFLSSNIFMDRAIKISVGSLSPTVNWKTLAKQEFNLPGLDQQKKIADLFWLLEENTKKLENLLKIQNEVEVSLLSDLFDGYKGKFVKLSEIASLTRGSSYKSSDYSDDKNGAPFLTLKSVSRNGTYSPDGLKWIRSDFQSDRIAKPNDLFIANTDLTPGRLLVGAPFYFPGTSSSKDSIFSMDLSKIDSKHAYLDNEYIYLTLKTLRARKYMVKNTRGSTVGHLDINSVLKLEVPLFNFETWDEVRRKAHLVSEGTSQIINETDELKILSTQLKEIVFGTSK